MINKKQTMTSEIILVILIIISLGFLLKTSISLREEKQTNLKLSELSLEWRNFVVTGDNVKIYINGEDFVALDGSNKSFSWWMRTTSEVKKIAFWNGTSDYFKGMFDSCFGNDISAKLCNAMEEANK